MQHKQTNNGTREIFLSPVKLYYSDTIIFHVVEGAFDSLQATTIESWTKQMRANGKRCVEWQHLNYKTDFIYHLDRKKHINSNSTYYPEPFFFGELHRKILQLKYEVLIFATKL